MKKYCGDCKYFERGCLGGGCKAPENIKTGEDYKGHYKYCINLPGEMNKNNDCKLFKPKWYKKRKYRE